MAEGKTSLLIKLSSTDTGARPLPSNTVFWTNQSIRLLHPSDTTIDDATTKAGVPTTIEVSVTNIGGSAVSDVRVEAYVCNPTSGQAGPAQAVAGTGQFTGFRPGVLSAGSTQPINCTLSGSAWTPTGAQAGHHCVIGNTWLDDGSEGVALGPTDLLDPLNNPHHGWRNINVEAMMGGMRRAKSVKFAFVVTNPDKKQERELVLSMREAGARTALGPAERSLLASGPFAKIKPTVSRYKTTRFTFEGPRIEPGPKSKLLLKPGERLELGLVAQFDARETLGNLHTFDITTANPNGTIVGGFRLLALAAN